MLGRVLCYTAEMREQILNAIRRLSEANGQPPGKRLFETSTGIKESAWYGVYWVRWSEALAEAGLAPNTRTVAHDEDFLFRKFADALRHFGRIPTVMELRMYGKKDPDFPNEKAALRPFGSKENMLTRLAEWATAQPAYNDVAAMLADREQPATETNGPATTVEGFVYLIRSGAHYKIGRSDELERRVKEIRIALPDAAALVHAIRTDDPAGIEAYWHRRFASRRANGEWFKLSATDVAAFKRRKYQ